MAINFPNSPANGATHTAAGTTFTYDATAGVWNPAGTGNAAITTDGSTPSLASGITATEVRTLIGAGTTAARTAVYATVDALPTSGNTQGDLAHVTANNTLYFWNGSGWYKIALINTNPSISGVASEYSLAIDGTATTVTITATDPEGLPITYSIASDTSGNTAAVSQGTGASTNVFTITPSTNTAHAGSFILTFRASDGVNVATAPATFTLQFSVQNSKYTTALITSVGANNAVNNSFDDKSTSDHTITANGDITQTTFSPYRHGGYSTYFDGTGDFLSVADHSDFEIGSGDFTMEAWIYLTGYSNSYGGVYAGGIMGKDSANNRSFAFSVQATSNSYTGLQLYLFNGGNATSTIGTASMGLNQWYHVAATRASGTVKLFLNGTQIQSGTNSTNIDNLSAPLVVGASSSYTNYEYRLKGYMRDARFINGTAAYTAAFTPPTESLTAVTNTKLLTCNLPYISDGSSSSHTITVNGDTSTKPFAPYDSQQYLAANHLGSLHSDGSGDYLAVDASSDFDLGTSDFTIEGWIYPTGYGNANFLVGQNYFSSIVQINSGKLQFYSSPASAYIITAATDIPLNAWTHWAVVRNGNAWTIYLNGKSDATATNAADAGFDSTNPLHIMRWNNSNGTTVGNVADLRFVKGTAVYTSNFTPPTAPLTAITNTKLLVQSTDAGIIDKAQGARSVNLIGDAKSSTTQTKYLSSSIKFDGSGDRITIPVDEVFEFGTGDFTIEMWLWYTGTIARYPLILGNGISGSGIYSGWAVVIISGELKLDRYTGSQTTTTFGSINAAADTWHHLAIARSGTTIRAFINGTQVGSDITNSISYNRHNSDPLNIGYAVDGAGTHQWNGYFSDIRITKGLARYTSNFTAPTAALQG